MLLFILVSKHTQQPSLPSSLWNEWEHSAAKGGLNLAKAPQIRRAVLSPCTTEPCVANSALAALGTRGLSLVTFSQDGFETGK